MRSYFYILIFFASLALIGCPGGAEHEDRWWEKPNLEKKGYIATFVGAANVRGDIPSARQEAEQEARRKIAAFIKVKIKSLTENFDKQMGDVLNKDSLRSFVNNETITREIINTAVKGSIPIEYKHLHEQDVMYVLVGLKDPGFLEKYKEQLESNLDQMIPDEKATTLEKTEAMKSRARERLDALIEKEKKNLK